MAGESVQKSIRAVQGGATSADKRASQDTGTRQEEECDTLFRAWDPQVCMQWGWDAETHTGIMIMTLMLKGVGSVAAV